MIDLITTHVQDAKDRLMYQFRAKARIEGIIEADAVQIQELEQVFYSMIEGRTLQTATGATLDRWGNVLDELRLGDTDQNFRSRLFFKVTRNIAAGTPEEMIRIYADLLQARFVQLQEVFDAKVVMTAITTANVPDLTYIKTLVQAVAPAGVRVAYLQFGTSQNPFVFATHPDLFGKGFDTYPVTGVGGEFTTAF
jgi:hypothetical protein